MSGRRALAAFFPVRSPALARVRYLELGKVAASHGTSWPAGMATRSQVMINSLSIDSASDRATVVVYPVHELWLYVGGTGKVRRGQFDLQSGHAWDATMADGPHRLALVHRQGRWLIANDFTPYTFGVVRMMRAGGAPGSVWRAEARRIAARTAHPIPVPPGVRATFERFLTLLNEHRYRATDALFLGGHGYRAKMFVRPFAHWHYALRQISGFDPFSEVSVASYPDVPFVVEASGPTYRNGGYDYAGGGMFGPAMWLAHRTPDGRWLIEGAGTGPPTGAGGPSS